MDNTNYAHILSARILALRKGKGLTQEALAQQLGVSFQAVSKWENGQSCPDIALLPLLADIFGIPVDSLFGREPEPPAAAEPAATPEHAFPYGGSLPWPGAQAQQGAVQPSAGKPTKLSTIPLSLFLVGFLLIAPFLLLVRSAVLIRAGGAPQTFFGLRFYSVITASMEPAIKQGSLIIVRLCMPENVQVGDIITYSLHIQDSQGTVTHRVIDIRTENGDETRLWFITKGDANAVADLPVSAEQLIGKVIAKLGGMGRLISRFGMFLPLALLSFPLCWGLAVLFLSGMALRGRRKRRRNAMAG